MRHRGKFLTLAICGIVSFQLYNSISLFQTIDIHFETQFSHSAIQKNIQNETKNEEKLHDPLNIIILYPDDWRHDDIGGVAPIVRTPFLNRLATKGIRFTYNAVTTSICWISRATLFTGQYVSRHGSTYLKKPLFITENWKTTWPFLLQQKGYFVGHVGKWQYKDIGGLINKVFDWTSFHEGRHFYSMRIGNEWQDVPAAARTRDDTLRFLKERPKDKPFALTVAFYPPKAVGIGTEPGAQWMPTNETRKIYENETIPEPLYDMNEAYKKLPYFLQNDRNVGRGRWRQRWSTPEHYQEGMKNYYALITDVDAACEEIYNQLEEDNLLNNTMIIFTTDNGLFHGAHGLAGKWYPYQESIRVPLIIYDPRMPQEKVGTLDDSMTLNIDLAETILGAANIPPAPLMQGRDISDLYLRPPSKNMSDPWRTEFYYEFPIGDGLPYDPSVTALVRKDWKYINWSDENYEQLFNLIEDPLELNDLMRDFDERAMARMQQIFESGGDPDSPQIKAAKKVQEQWVRLVEMKKRHDELRIKVMEPIFPGSKCDPLWKRDVPIPDYAPDC